MAQKTSWNGATLTEADINLYLMGEGGAWTTWTPTVTQSVSVTVTVASARFARYGRTIIFRTALTVTGSGTASNAVSMSLPATSAASGFVIPGGGLIFDTTASLNYPGLTYLSSTTAVGLVPSATNANGVLGAVGGFTAGLAAGDLIQISGVYEAAS